MEEKMPCTKREVGKMHVMSSLKEELIQEVTSCENDIDFDRILQSHVAKSLDLHPEKKHFKHSVNNLKQMMTDLWNHTKPQHKVLHQIGG